jgi:SAM-dependent methyltransferase
MNLKEQMDTIYRDLSLEEIPWNLEQAPRVLVDLIDSGEILPGKAIDIGCGAGNYAVWLANQGFQVTGVDLSPRAIELAERLAGKSGVPCGFVVADLLGEALPFQDSFDFAYDWEVLHHIFPEDRRRYVTNVHRVLRPGARYLSVCFSENDDPGFGGEGKVRKTPLGTMLYFSSEQEIQDLFEPFFDMDELTTIEVAGKFKPHAAVKALMTKKD